MEQRETHFEIKRQIYHKLRRSVAEMGVEPPKWRPIGQHRQPDVRVIAVGHTLVFQPQNLHAANWLHQRCGLAIENWSEAPEIRVHPALRRRIVEELQTAGFEIADPIHPTTGHPQQEKL